MFLFVIYFYNIFLFSSHREILKESRRTKETQKDFLCTQIRADIISYVKYFY